MYVVRDGVEYESLEAIPETELRAEAAAAVEVILDATPFYAEGGGQIGRHPAVRMEEPEQLPARGPRPRVLLRPTPPRTEHHGRPARPRHLRRPVPAPPVRDDHLRHHHNPDFSCHRDDRDHR